MNIAVDRVRQADRQLGKDTLGKHTKTKQRQILTTHSV